MAFFRNIKSRLFIKRQKGFIDVVVVFGIFVISAILVLGLFPRGKGSEGRLMYLYTMMSVPIIIGMYFIIISFRRSIARDVAEAESSLRTRITLMFIFIAVLPTIPVVIISNTVMNRLMNQITSVDPAAALTKAIEIAREDIVSDADNLRTECEWLRYAVENGIVSAAYPEGRRHLANIMMTKGYVFQCFQISATGALKKELLQPAGDSGVTRFTGGVRTYASLADFSDPFVVSLVSIDATQILAGFVPSGSNILVLYRVMPEERFTRVTAFTDTLAQYEKNIASRPIFQSIAGLLLFILAIGMVLLSIILSLYLSKNITRPVMELANAAKEVAAGNLSISLKRNSPDEFAVLFGSFNSMVRQLRENHEAVYVVQKLNAWREVSRKLLHEIKNPLTPIKLSAERIRLRYSESHHDISNIIMKGTETIIEEVNAIQRILDEFTHFARLPEIKPEKQDLNAAIKSYVQFFHGHENIVFIMKFDPKLPHVLFDRLLLRQAFINIAKNAIEAMENRGVIEVITGMKNASTVFLEIHDNGPGISSADIGRLFDPTFSRKKTGTGLGLSIVEKIALDHKGRVYCNSVSGKGAAFTIELPVNIGGTP